MLHDFVSGDFAFIYFNYFFKQKIKACVTFA